MTFHGIRWAELHGKSQLFKSHGLKAHLSPGWSFRRNLSEALRKDLEKSIQENDVLVFMKGTKNAPQCGFSRAVMQIMDLQGVHSFSTVNVLENEDVRQGIKELTSWPTIPQVFVKGEFVGGCDIMINMHQSGELEKLLKEKGILPPAAADASSSNSSTSESV
jgi:monothiol glutaredoxin